MPSPHSKATTILLWTTDPEEEVERLHVNYLRELIHRLRLGQSERAIANDLSLSRNTVSKYRELAKAAGYLDPGAALPETQVIVSVLGPEPQPPRAASTVLPYQQLVEQFLADGVEMMTIFDRLNKDHGYTGSYSSVRRFVHQLRPVEKRLTVRVHCAPGEEAQVDFGSAGMQVDPADGRWRQAYVFVMTLCFSRHQYAEMVFDQKIRTWLALHRRAFASFGGVPAKIVPDNLKAAVLKAALHDPVLGEAYRRFAQHYGFIVSPTRPGTPEHKGKVENGVHFVRRSFLAGQTFADIREGNQKLAIWVKERAGTREHGSTHQPPLALFEAHERAKLLPLPRDPFELTETKVVKLHPDCHVVIDGSYYSAPYQYVGEELVAYVFERMVQIFRGTELLTTHPRATRKGEWHTRNEHYPPEKAAFLEKTPERCRELARRMGPATTEVVENLLAERPLDQLRSVQAILRLADSVGPQRLEAACRRALFFGDGRYRRIKAILNAALDQVPLTDTKPSAKPMASFAFQRTAAEFFGAQELIC
jgi:transposase